MVPLTTIPLLDELAKRLDIYRTLVSSPLENRKMLAELGLLNAIIALYDDPQESRQIILNEICDPDPEAPEWWEYDRLDDELRWDL